MRARLSVWGALFVAVAASTPDVRFVDATKAAGIAFAHKNSATSNKYLIETMGGGVALLDYDNDGRLDIFLTNGARLDDPMPAGKRPDKSDAAFWNRLYRQTPDGTFVDATEKAGLTGMPQDQYGMGVAVGDYDNDGFEDLYVTNYGANTLYHNNGNGTFTDLTNRAGVAAGGWSTSAGFFDYDNDGKLDLFVARYVDWSFSKNRYCGEKKEGYRAYCHPDNFDGRDEHPVSQQGDGTFADVSAKSGLTHRVARGWASRLPITMTTGSWMCMSPTIRCSRSCSTTTGTARSKRSGCWPASGSTRTERRSPEWVSTSATTTMTGGPTSSSPICRTNATGCSGRTRTAASEMSANTTGLGGATLSFSGWSTRFFDYDHDGWKDIFVAQGHVMDTIEKTAPNLKYLQPPLLLRNESARFVRVAAGDVFQQEWAGRGAAFGDLDNDGDIDVVLSNVGQNAVVLRNEGGNQNRWLQIRTVGTRSNRDGIGCRVKVSTASGPTQYFTVSTAVGYLSASDKRLTVGLGRDAVATLVEIRWPSGVVQRFENVKAGQTLTATEPGQ